MGNFKEDLAKIKAFAFDCDGVMTDSTVEMNSEGQLIRKFNAKDGYAIVKAMKVGYPVAIVSGGHGEIMEKRFKSLGVTDIYQSCTFKIEAIDDFRFKYGVEREEILFMGDDMPDIEPMLNVGLGVAPADAVIDVKAVARHVSEYAGGMGCVRDVIEQVLKAQGKWNEMSHNCQ